jgi:hypothetical protein
VIGYSLQLRKDRRGRWEVRFLSDGQLFASQSLSSRGLAIHCADVMHDEFAADGWIEVPG